MTDKEKLTGLLHAYSLGCLDSEELNLLKEHFREGGEYPWQELGEYQNLIALFPSILNIEKPGPDLKDKVARKLYRLKTEKETPKDKQDIAEPIKIEQEKFSGEPRESEQEIVQKHNSDEEPQIDIPPSIENEVPDLNPSEFEEVKSKKSGKSLLVSLHDIDVKDTAENKDDSGLKENTGQRNKHVEAEENMSHAAEKIKDVEFKEQTAEHPEKTEKKKNSVWLILAAVFFLVIAAGSLFMYFNLSKEVKEYKSGIQNLNEKINNLSSKMNDSQDLRKIFQSKDIEIVNLKGTNLSPESFGKLIIGTINKNCILQLSDLPALPGNRTYQMWMKNDGQYMSLGVFKPTKSVNYFHFTLPNIQNLNITDFILTSEPSSGSDTPGKMIYLNGTLQ